MIKFTRNDLKDERTLERLLRRITEDLEGLMRTSFGTLRDLLYFDKVKDIFV